MKCCFLFLTVMLIPILSGCSEEKRPEGFPKLYPLVIEILQEGAPLDQAGVDLISDNPEIARWPSGGTTDINGQVRIYTYGFPGAPEGKFRVTVSKTLTEGQTSSVADGSGKGSQKVFQLIDSVYGSIKDSPLSVTVQPGQTTPIRFDVGKKVKKLIPAP